MDRYTVEYLPAALDDLTSIFNYILESSQNRTTAERYIDRLYQRCERIADAPLGGVARPELGANLRMAVFERSAVILYVVEDHLIGITNIFSGGQDYEALLRSDR
ncbi:type II toxin-antitoxin system RelE/ParE family toxin [Rhizobium sp. 18055]|uniref:type II toxin-antitoxin system RelE/ParE family toxin n=1 Tax=Rhizobium sp. 18055 TaxID=2681403 RepID=UPI00135B4273|nr:type II toxin-antitoxin system RelE/ParE family toxin [Rhizobium sp. 18055]